MKNYKKKYLIRYITVLYIFIIVLFILYSLNNYYSKYKIYRGTFLLDNMFEIIVPNKSLKYLEKNKYIYINSIKKKYKIININKNIYKNNNLVVLKINNLINKNKIIVSIYDDKEKLINIFKIFFKED